MVGALFRKCTDYPFCSEIFFFFTLPHSKAVFQKKLKYSFIVLVLQQIFVLTINDVLV